MNQQRTKWTINSFLLHVLSFLLLWEWLRPVEQLTDTSHIVFFVGFIAGALLLAFLEVPRLVSAISKMIYILFCIQFIHYGSFSVMVNLFLGDVIQNTELILKGQWTGLSDSIRTLLFFSLLWITVYLIHYWLMIRNNILFFFFATIVFITVLDTFSPYSAQTAIIRSVLIGFVLMGILAFRRLTDSETQSMMKLKWMASVAVFVVGSTVIAFAAPKADPVWPNPVPFVKSLGGSGNTSTDETGGGGFRSDDSELGGPFLPSSEVVFTAEVEEEHYWKVDTRDEYTGKGWISSTPDEQPLTFRRRVPPSFFSFTEEVPSEERTSIVYNEEDHGYIPYPHGLERIEASSSYRYELNEGTGKIIAINGDEQEAPASYSIQYKHASFRAEELQNSSLEEAGSSFQAIAGRYTQLPENIPPQIRELALDITEEHETWFEKAKAIEAYFSSSGFTYEQVDVPVPSEGEDYVAQFLFDTRRGYCDNFSTSMAVMLRTIDIPARWVKGYTEGTYLETTESGNQLYQVTGENAHSWVEVFFPGIGWVPFEPTQGFTNAAVPELEETSQTPVNEEIPAETPTETPEQSTVEDPTQAEEGLDEDSREASEATTESFLKTNWKTIAFLAGAALILAALCYRYRRKWMPFYYIFMFKQKKEDHHFPEAYLVLLAQLDRSGLKRKKGQTLSGYAKEIDTQFSSSTMSGLTAHYEQYLYRDRLPNGTWNHARNEWESLMKKTSS
ncbi:transglutaminaseTgpA domain-containing protein [Domibacillus sp. DTU_2020_1001157_1_SI_ALB_TIR_016]|uniref:transglutaminase TgpA family protein n=1 Tax=Domibacillus sp. DTU_2020_1001157_1_SI_ALB_TIR_016 TaxID=3077789 RepID=UPI0028F131F0|nr:transglutaminaseTgpA domain-containing protein [Domibacillus sp. DTU_2020_1001157_1_SI_ALB_TIR_016]WNS78575.1 transglutaminaseTgpA domain-containing protein [Domibacillus sp. DTU_2020_1001157_1_SI_ALB_TIR_016]